MGRATRGVRGIKLSADDYVVGLVVADPDMALLTVCERGYGKRTPFGSPTVEGEIVEPPLADADAEGDEESPSPLAGEADEDAAADVDAPDSASDVGDDEAAGSTSTGARYRRQGRGGKGLRDIKTTARNGRVVDVVAVSERDEILMITAGGKIQRIRAADVSLIGRNTQGVRIIRLDDDDTLASMARIPSEIASDEPSE